MLSYRHGYHAGNHADVLKHLTLIALIQAMQRKDSALAYIETHAGAGEYDLTAAMAEKVGEWHEGIGRIRAADGRPELVETYLDLMPQERHYPGSPLIARRLLRPQDRAQLCELHPSDSAALQQLFTHDKQVTVHARDGFDAIRALLPPQQKRGLIVIDPSYERVEDYRAVVKAARELHKRFRAGVIAIWYPRLIGAPQQRMLGALDRIGIDNSWRIELDVREGGSGLFGSGVQVLNAPWQVDTRLDEILPWLTATLDQGGGSGRIIRAQPV